MFNNIEVTKKRLNHLIENLNYQLNNKEIIKLSQELDELILTYYETTHGEKAKNNSYFA